MTNDRLPTHPAQRLDRSRTVTFDFAGQPIPAYAGDTVVSALYAAISALHAWANSRST